MTNKERYQRTFSALHASEYHAMEEFQMQKTRKRFVPRLVTVCAVVALVAALAVAAYAADLGGIQRTVQLWIHGDQTDAILEVQDGTYTLTYEDVDGNLREQSGGGIAMDGLGNERALTEEEILEQLNMPDVEYEDDGSVWIYYQNQKLEITDKFDDDGVCYVQLKNGDDTLYVTVKYDNGYATSPDRFLSPREFN